LIGSTSDAMTAEETITPGAAIVAKYIFIRSERTATTDQTISIQQVRVFGTLSSAPNLAPPATTTTTTTTTTRAPSATPVADYINVNYTTTTIELSYTAFGGTPPYTYAWYRSLSPNFPVDNTTLISGATGATYSDTNVLTAELYFYKVKVTDANSASVNSFETGAILPPTSLTVGLIGDSITVQNQTLRLFCGIVSNAFGIPVSVRNAAVSGSRTSQWVSGQTNMTNALASFNTAPKLRWVMVMLGTNDAKNAPITSQADYQTNLTNIVNTLVSNGYKVILNAPPSLAGAFLAENKNIEDYIQTFKNLVDNKNCFMGNIKNYYIFAANKKLIPDTVHPSLDRGNELLQRSWADTFISIANLSRPSNSSSISSNSRSKSVNTLR
jgi:lysophospholipase L1-like esterase